MSDTNLDPSITSVTNRAVAVASTANPRELLNISRIGPSLEQTENANLEITLNARAEDLAASATANELKNLGGAIGNLLEPQSNELLMDWREGFLPDQRFASGQFLKTSGSHQKSWGGVTTTTLDELELVSIATGESLVYNSASGKFENSSNTSTIAVYSTTGDLPISPATGNLAYVTVPSDVYYYTGSEWMLVSDVYSGIYRGTWMGVNLTQSSLYSAVAKPISNVGFVLDVDSAPTTGTRWDGDLTQSSLYSAVAKPISSTSFVLDVDSAPTTGTRWDGDLTQSSLYSAVAKPISNVGFFLDVDSAPTTGTRWDGDLTQSSLYSAVAKPISNVGFVEEV
jgi:predicted secreted protein